jgi:hypothetical protein
MHEYKWYFDLDVIYGLLRGESFWQNSNDHFFIFQTQGKSKGLIDEKKKI